MFRCPVCRGDLDDSRDATTWHCADGHSYDVAREGYVNLLAGKAARHKTAGDDADMVKARRTFLGTGAYDPVRDAVLDRVADTGAVLDVGCGEGHYLAPLDGDDRRAIGGIDLSKPAVRLAAKRASTIRYAVASAYDVPVHDASVTTVVNVFGPVAPEELLRVLRPDGGAVVTASPAPRHLTQLKRLVLDTADEHELAPPAGITATFDRLDTTRLTYDIEVAQPALTALLAMTPYAWRASPSAKEQLEATDRLTITVDVLVTLSRSSPR